MDIAKVAGTHEKEGLDIFHFHEVLHSTHLIENLFNDSILSHPAVMKTPELEDKAKEVAEKLTELYQTAGFVRFNHS